MSDENDINLVCKSLDYSFDRKCLTQLLYISDIGIVLLRIVKTDLDLLSCASRKR